MSDETNIVDTTEAEMDALGKDNYVLRRENAELRERLAKAGKISIPGPFSNHQGEALLKLREILFGEEKEARYGK